MIFVPEINQKGGVGKSTTTANTGAELARRGLRVLLIDLDPQATLTEATVGGVEEGSAEILGFGLAASEDLRTTFDRVVVHSPAFQVDVLGANYDRLFGHQDVMKSQTNLMLRLLDLLEVIEGRYDVVLADCPPNLGPLTLAAIYASTGIVVVVETSEEAMKGLAILTKTIDGARRMMRLDFPIAGAVLTKYRAGEVMADDVKSALEQTALFPWVLPISRTEQFKAAFSARKPLRAMMTDDVHRRAVREIGAIADRIVAMMPQEASASRG